LKEQRKKRKIMQTLGKENKNYIFQSHYRHDTEKKKRKNWVRIEHGPPAP
jgi:hypothetical protein